jgi:hypothetical protein
LRKVLIEDKVRLPSLFIAIILLMIIPVMIGHFSNIAIEVYAQRSSSCDRVVVSPVDCSPPTSSSSSSDNSIATHDIDEKDNNDGDNDKGDNSGDQKEDKESGDIESMIPSTAGGGVPFP